MSPPWANPIFEKSHSGSFGFSGDNVEGIRLWRGRTLPYRHEGLQSHHQHRVGDQAVPGPEDELHGLQEETAAM